MIFVAELEVAPAKSPVSTSATLRPRSRASRAQAAPTAPPPITHWSKDFPTMFCRTIWRDFILNSHFPGNSVRVLRLDIQPLLLVAGLCNHGSVYNKTEIEYAHQNG